MQVEHLIARLEDERDELKYCSRAHGEQSALDPSTAQRIANTMYEAMDALSSLTRELEAQRDVLLLCQRFTSNEYDMRGSDADASYDPSAADVLQALGKVVLSSAAPREEGLKIDENGYITDEPYTFPHSIDKNRK